MALESVREVLKQGIAVVNAQQKLMKVDWAAFVKELQLVDEAGLMVLVEDFKALDLSDDNLEARLEKGFGDAAPYIALVLRLAKVFLPK